jgi:uncharacterized membrane protein (DUF2068 family)
MRSFLKRPVGLTILALLLGWLAIGAFVLSLTAETMAQLHARWELVRLGALVYGLTAVVAAIGLWRLRRWGYLAFLAWIAVVLSMSLWWPAVFPQPVMPWWTAFLWIGIVGALLVPLALYVRRAIASAA